ncbi:hypothetical protein ACLOJK_010253 [Asimina triloba]
MSTAGGVLSPVREEFVPGCLRGGALSHCSQESILIFVTLSGSVIPMRVMESDSIALVKLRIQSYQGFMVKKQKLVYRGRELARNDSLVRDYGLTDGNVLHLVIRLSDLRFIIVQTACGKEFKFHVDKCKNVGYVKQQIAKKGNDFIDVNNQELICDGEKLNDEKVINDLCIKNDAVIHLLVRKSAKVHARPVEKDFELSIVASHTNGGSVREEREEEVRKWTGDVENLPFVQKEPPDRVVCLEPVIVNQKIELPDVALDLIKATFAGLENGNNPVRSSEGCGGAYFMQDFSGKKYVAVFKPMDEEPMAVNNPHGLPLTSDGEGLKRGTKVGEGALREVAAFILDHPKSGRRSFTSDEIGFAGVPPTVLIRCLNEAFNHPHGFERSAKNVKIGSLQMFVKNGGSCEDMGPQAFPVEEVHKISVLDIRLANADRHAGNILICREGKDAPITLVPIDHGYCLPENVSVSISLFIFVNLIF